MVEFNTPLKYHMNDLVYYYGVSTGGNLGKQIGYLCAWGAMMKGMLYKYDPDDARIIEEMNGIDERKKRDASLQRQSYLRIQNEVDTFIKLTDLLSQAYFPLIDTNPYLFKRASRIRKGVNIAAVLGFHIIEEHNLVAGNIIRGRLAEHLGKDRIKGNAADGGNDAE